MVHASMGNGWFRWRAALVLHSSGSFWKSWRFIHVSFFALISKWGLFSRYLQCFQSENEKVPSISLQLFSWFFEHHQPKSIHKKKHPPQDTSELKNAFWIFIYQLFFFSEWLTHLDVFGWRLLYIPPWWLNCYVSSACFPEIQTELKRRRRESKVPSPRVQIAAKLLWNLGWNHEPG